MAGKAWCCGGGTSGSSGGGEPLVTENSATATLTGAGTAADPLVATAVVAPFEPNGLTAAGNGLVVRPSDDANNALIIGSDGDLYVPAAEDVISVVPVTPDGDFNPVSTERSVNVDVVESPPGTFTVGARLSVPWGDTGVIGHDPNPFDGTWRTGVTAVIPETGIYDVDCYFHGYIGVLFPRTTADYGIDAGLAIDGTRVRASTLLRTGFSASDGTGAAVALSLYWVNNSTYVWRGQLNAGQTLTSTFLTSGTYVSGDGVTVQSQLSWHKISD
jgi:hypothetical protein